MIFDRYRRLLEGLAKEGRLRAIPGEDSDGGLLDLTSNDYMGLASDMEPLPLCWEGLPDSLRDGYMEYLSGKPMERADQWSSSASRLLSGRQQVFSLLEKALEADYGRPALLFNSGYHANMGAVGALASGSVRFFVDKLMHASAYDALSASRADFVRFRHNDLNHLKKLLDEAPEERLKIVVTESIFSMGGDRGRLRELVDMKRKCGDMLLYVDEAHGFGCFGERGLGLCEQLGVMDEIDIIVGTFGKAAASAGAFVVAAEPLHTLFVNAARSFIFSTALPPVVILRSLENYLRLRGAKERRCDLRNKADEIAAHLDILREDGGSQILPIVAGDASEAVEIARRLRQAGIKGMPIRRPTVPPGQERVRLSVSATLDLDEFWKRIDNFGA